MAASDPTKTVRDTVTDAVTGSLLAHGLDDGDVVVAAFSGGPDSTALLHALATASRETGPAVDVVAAHFDHALRPGSELEADAARRAAENFGIPFLTRRAEGPVDSTGTGLEHAARNDRYAFLTDVVRDSGARALATAHHLDNRVETVLHRLLQGSRLPGLTGIPRSRPLDDSGGAIVFRPFHNLPRSALQSYLAVHDLEAVEDPTNVGDANARARLRSRILPVLEETYPHVRDSILRLEALALECRDLLEREAEGVPTCREEDTVWIPRSALDGAGAESVRHHLRRLAELLGPGRPDVPEAAVLRIMDALAREDGKERRTPVGGGLEAAVSERRVALSRTAPA